MKLLFLTQYFPPEVGAPQNRIFEMAKELITCGHQASILTGMPNYPGGKIFPQYRNKFFVKEIKNGMTVYRTWLYVKKTSVIFLRLLNYFSFVFFSLFFGLFIPQADVIIVESPPLFLGISGFLLKKLKHSKLIFNVSDLWPKSAVDLCVISNKYIIGMSYKLEMFIYKHADFITVQTNGIYQDIISRGIDKNKISIITNGVDINYFKPMKKSQFWQKKINPNKKFIIGYIGNHGIAQKLDTIIEATEKIRSNTKIIFLLVGDGPDKERLLAMIKEKKLTNIVTLPVQEKNMIPGILSVVDLCIVPLKKMDLFLGAVPSKMLEYMSAGKPILLGVKGEAEGIINKAKAGIVFEPEDSADLIKKINYMYKNRPLLKDFGKNARKYIIKNYNRRMISAKFNHILSEIY